MLTDPLTSYVSGSAQDAAGACRPQRPNSDAYARTFLFSDNANAYAIAARHAGATHASVRPSNRGYRVVVAHNAKALGMGNPHATHASGRGARSE